MPENKPENAGSDPLAPLVEFYDNWTKSWSGAMSEMVASKSFADSMSKQVESNLEALALVRRQVDGIMEQYLQQMNLPSRKEVISLAERLTKLEMSVDDLDAKLDDIIDLLKSQT
jgi:polyhydroxyalkanoate synthesis regulator phasin